MNKRLLDAYDRMTMPDACARRIEGQLECQLRERKKGRYTRIQPPEPKTNWWAVGAALVCLVLAVSVGGTFLMLNLANDLPEQSTNATQPSVPETTAEETTGENETLKEYSDGEVYFQYPEEWDLQAERIEDAAALTVKDSQNQNVPSFQMLICDAELVNLDMEYGRLQSQVREVYPEAQDLELSETTVAGQDACKVVYTYTDWEINENLTMTHYLTKANGIGYHFYFCCPTRQEDVYREGMDALIASIRFGMDAQDYTYTENPGGTLTLTNYLGDKEVVTVPDKIEGKQVTAVGDGTLNGAVFKNCKTVRSVTIPEGIERIGNNAFYYCENLESVTIPASVGELGDYAFCGCYNLRAVYFEGDAPYVGDFPFYAADNATIYYHLTADGWSDPWFGCPAKAYEELERFPLDLQGLNFLEILCYAMPDWEGEDSLDDSFWNEFLFRSFSDPDLVAGEEALLFGRKGQDMYRVSQETVENYVMLALGELPQEFHPAWPELDYENGYLYILAVSRQDVEYALKGVIVREDGTQAVVVFDCYSGTQENVVGSVRFVIVPAQNDNGFVVTAKKQEGKSVS